MLEWILGNTVGGCGLDSSGSGQQPVVSPSDMVMSLWVPKNLTSCVTTSF